MGFFCQILDVHATDPHHIRISLTKHRFVVTHTLRQTDIPALLDSWDSNTPAVRIVWYQVLWEPFCWKPSCVRSCGLTNMTKFRDFSKVFKDVETFKPEGIISVFISRTRALGKWECLRMCEDPFTLTLTTLSQLSVVLQTPAWNHKQRSRPELTFDTC